MRKILLIFFAIFFLGVISSFGQKYRVLGSSPGTIIACPAGHEDMHSRVGTPWQNGLMTQKKTTSTTHPTSEIQIIFRGNDAKDPDFRRACRYAADIWERYIVSSVPIVIEVGFERLDLGVLAKAGATKNFILTDDTYPNGRIFPVALANALFERDLAPNEPDIRVRVSSHFLVPYYYGTDGDPWPWQYDLVTVMLHEIGHGLGFSTSHNVEHKHGSYIPVYGPGSRSRTPFRYDDFLENGSGTEVTDIPTPSNNLADFYTSNDLFINGPNTVYRFGGNRPRIHSPFFYKRGSSISHWDEGSFPSGNPNSLMTPKTGLNEAIHKPGTITLGLFADLGWTIHENGSFTADGIRFQITSSSPKTVMAVDYIGTASVVTIPEKVGGHTVNAIGNGAFKGNGLTSVTIPDGVISIGQDAFRGNQLTSIVIPNNVTSIGLSAFRANQLQSVVIPDNVTTIGTFAFRENQLSSITLGTNVTAIGYGTFKFNQLTDVVIPNGVVSIGGEAFANNPITKVMAQGVATVPTIVTNNTFTNRSQIDVIVPKGKGQAYLNRGWTDFKNIIDAQIGDTFIADNITYKITSIVPNTVMATDYNTAGGDIVTIPQTVDYGPNTYTVTEVGSEAFKEKQLAEVTFITPSNVTSIGNNAFQGNKLTRVDIPDNVTNIGMGAFVVNKLERVVIPNSVTHIENAAFSHNQLTEVTIPDGVTDIRGHAFASNPIKTVVAQGVATVPTIVTGNTFSNRQEIDLIMPKGKMEDYWDKGWRNFKSITEVAEIGDTFTANNITYKITDIAPNTVTATVNPNTVTIVDYPGSATSLNIPPTVDHGPNTYTVASIGENAFQNKGLASVTIPNGVTSIEERAFLNNQLISVTIPGNVGSIGDQAFFNNPTLCLVTVEATNPPSLVAANAFTNRTQIHLVIPRGTLNAYQNQANGWTGFRSTTEEVADGDNFTVESITYKVTVLGNPNTVTIVDYPGSATSVNIPPTVDHGPNTYTVTSIGERAFSENDLTQVTIPGSVASIEDFAFRDNQLISVTMPGNVGSIGFQAFYNNPNLGLVVVERNDPPTLDADAFQGVANTDLRNQIDVVVPSGAGGNYEDQNNGWTGFKSITEGIGVSIDAPAETANLSAFTVTFRFDLDVTGFAQEDIANNVVNATVVDGSFSQVNGSTYTIEMTPTSCGDAITIDIPEKVAEYKPSFPNLAASTTVKVNPILSVPTVSSISPICSGEDAVFTITGAPGDIVTYSGASDGRVTIETGGTVDVTINEADSDTALELIQVTNGNCSMPLTGKATVTVKNGPLTAIAQNITVQLDASGQVTITPQQVDNGSHGSCNNGPISLSLDRTNFSCDDIGSPVTVTLTATDGNNTPATAMAVIEVVDKMPPIAIARDHTVRLDASGNARIEASDINNGSFDNCNISHMSLSQEVFNDTGDFPITLTVKDTGENSHTATAVVTVEPYSAQIGDVFTVSDMDYEITSINPNEVKVVDYIGSATEVKIPETVDNNGETYTVTAIDATAFNDNPGLSTMKMEATHPPSLHENAFTVRGQINLIVPVGMRQAYLDNGWDGFRSITEEGQVITSVGNIKFKDFTVYPNPARDKVHIDPRSGQELKQVNIYTLAGVYLYSENGLEINTSRLSGGVYLFEIVTKTGNRSIKKVIIQ